MEGGDLAQLVILLLNQIFKLTQIQRDISDNVYSEIIIIRLCWNLLGEWSYLIFVTYITYIKVEKNSVMWRNFRFQYMTDVEKFEISPHAEEFQIFPHNICGEM